MFRDFERTLEKDELQRFVAPDDKDEHGGAARRSESVRGGVARRLNCKHLPRSCRDRGAETFKGAGTHVTISCRRNGRRTAPASMTSGLDPAARGPRATVAFLDPKGRLHRAAGRMRRTLRAVAASSPTRSAWRRR